MICLLKENKKCAIYQNLSKSQKRSFFKLLKYYRLDRHCWLLLSEFLNPLLLPLQLCKISYVQRFQMRLDQSINQQKQIQHWPSRWYCCKYRNNILLIWSRSKEYIERRHGEPFKFLFLPKMGLLGSQAVLEKKVQFWIMSNFLALFFQLFMGKNLFF
jgi:hypothetical protein